MSEPIVSVHIPKTGGVTFREALAAAAGGRVVLDYDDRPLAPRSFARALRERLRRVELPPDARAVHGHFVASKYRRRYPNARFVTWFRDPVERLASHYYYWLREPDPKNATCRRLLEERLDIVAFGALPEMRDVHARFLGAVPVEDFAFVGLTEAFDEGMALFQRLFGLATPPTSPRRNANPERRGERYDLAPDVRAALERIHAADVALYARARARFEALRGDSRAA
ncbi:MAG TPA: hypothetical protein VHQ66_01975 [Myxococcota bacterium]|nr:hypothetical protein [Myxococcota bacterium]